MIEPIMFVGIGFLVAGLLVIGVIPLVHARAVRLTMKRIEAVTPLSMAEIQADKDQLRAGFAMATRRLEMTIEQEKAKTTSQLAEIGKRSEAIGRLKLELGEKTAELLALEAKEKQLTDDLRNTENELAARTATLQETEQSLAGANVKIGELTGNLNEAKAFADGQRVELVALAAQAEMLKKQIETLEGEVQDLTERLRLKTVEFDASQQQLGDERGRSGALSSRIDEVERQILAKTTESEILELRARDLLARIDEQDHLLAEGEYASDQLRNELAAADIMRAEKVQIEDQLRQTQDERAKLLRENEQMRRKAEASWEVERMENAVMRERIHEVAAEVARLTSQLEGPGNAIEAILAMDASRTHAGLNGLANGNGTVSEDAISKSTLADRIRMLQRRASRVLQSGRA
jgi:chromosome segregation ATPase